MRVFRILGIGFLLLALLAGAGLAWALWPGRYEGWIQTTGVVVGHSERVSTDSDGHRSVTYALVVKYADEQGKEYTGISSVSTSHPKAIGATVEVTYPPGRPGNAQFDGEGRFFPTLFFGIWAGVLGVLGIVFTLVGFKSRGLDPRPVSTVPDPWAVEDHSESPTEEDTSEPSGPVGELDHGIDDQDRWPRLPRRGED